MLRVVWPELFSDEDYTGGSRKNGLNKRPGRKLGYATEIFPVHNAEMKVDEKKYIREFAE